MTAALGSLCQCLHILWTSHVTITGWTLLSEAGIKSPFSMYFRLIRLSALKEEHPGWQWEQGERILDQEGRVYPNKYRCLQFPKGIPP